MDDEIKLQSPVEALHSFSKTLTAKVRELDELERQYQIVPGQATEILQQMIESHLYAVFKTMLLSNRVSQEDKEAAVKAITLLEKNK